ncbi:MBL fold metallo-hydrolase [Agarilytica rhodophyticola]|uniref:MBL fold metallo-hydrolase n=1 Tax=Agarilytica rhodophyticola TaxID=1737490 RepID=UPI000B34290C|nr:MBL fold metallo-hydrolase [Agarilytica rhodophyticola]
MRTMIIKLIAVSVFLVTAITQVAYAQFAEPPVFRKITQVADGLYRFQNNNHFSVFLVTPEGVIVTDPINKEAAKWLKSEIHQRFKQPIKYLILSHDHPDHSSGGEVFAEDGATVIAHQKTKDTILGEKRPTAIPELTYENQMTVELGGEKVELIYLGKNSSDNTTLVQFPEERAVFAVDFVVVNRLPFKTLKDAYFPEWIESIDRLALLDFDMLIPGHGGMGTKQDAVDHGQYLKDLYAAVLQGIRSGKSLEELKASLKLDAYKDWWQYDAWLPLNIEGVYKNINLHRRAN